MVHTRRYLRFAALAALTLGLVTPAGLAGQLAVSRSNTVVLVMEPVPQQGVDTAFALAVADAMRDRMDSKFRFQLRVISTETICEAKEASGFTCDHIFAPANAPALARFLQAQGYLVSWLSRGGDSLRLRVRFVNSAGSGLSGWETYAAPASQTAEQFGRTVADALERQVEAADDARECDQRRSQSDFRRARERARDAFQVYPDHPAAAMCAALLFEVQGQPIDSIIWALRKAVRGDSAAGSAWEMLGRRLVERGDTAGAIDAFLMQLAAEPGNIRLRQAIAAQMVAMGQYSRADSVIGPAIEFNQGDLNLLSLREQACYEGHMWPCALATMEETYQLDSARQQSLDFKFKAFSGAQSWEAQADSAGDQAVVDSAVVPALLRWSQRIVEHDSSNVDAWRARSQALQAAGRPLDAVGAYRRILALDPSQVSAAYAAAAILWDSTTMVIDSTTPLDTARLFLGDSLWTRVTQLATDTATWTNVAVQFYNVGRKLIQNRVRPQLGRQYMMRVLELDRTGALAAPANFFAGFVAAQQMGSRYQTVVQGRRCADINPLMEFVGQTKRELQAGRSVAPQIVDQFLGVANQIEGQREALRANFCR